MAEVARLTAVVDANIAGFQRAMGQVTGQMAGLSGKVSHMGSQMSSAGMTMTRGLTLPLVAGFGFAVKAAADFESALNEMQAVSGATARQMEQVSGVAKQLGADVKLPGTSAKDAALAMVELAKGGLSVQQSMDAARATLLLSAAAQVDNARAAQITSDALNAFGLEASQASHVVDVLAGGANASSASIEQMADGLQMSSAVAATLGVSLDDTVTALSLFANAGIKGSDAGTSLKTAMLGLANPTKESAALMQELGIKVFDSSGKMKPLALVAEELKTGLAGMTQQQKLATLAQLGGTDAVRVLSILTKEGAAGFNEMAGAVTKSGQAQAIADAKMKGFHGALEGLKSAVETAAISLGEKFLPQLTALLQKVPALIDKISALPKPIQDFGLKAAGAAAVLGPLLLVLGKLAQGFGFLMSPIGLAVGAIAALAAGVVFAYQKIPAVRDAVDELAAAFRSGNWDQIASQFDGLGAAFGPLVDVVRNAVAGVKAHLGEFAPTLAAVKAIFQGTFPILGPIVQGAVSAVGTILGGLLSTIGNMVRLVGALLRGDWAAAWEAMKNLALTPLRTARDLMLNLLGTLAAVFGPPARAAGAAIVAGIQSGLSAVAGAFTSAWAAVRTSITGFASTVAGTAKSIGFAIVAGVRDGLGTLVGFVRDKFQDLWAWIQGAAGSAFAFAFRIGSQIVQGILSGLGGLFGALKARIEGGLRDVLNAINPFSPIEAGAARLIGEPIARGIIAGFLLGIRELPTAIEGKLREAFDRAKGVVQAAQGALSSAFGTFSSDVLAAFDSITAAGPEWVQATEQRIAETAAAFRRGDLVRAVEETQAKINEAMANGMDQGSAEYLALVRDHDRAVAALQAHDGQIAIAEERKRWEEQRGVMRIALEGRLADLSASLASGNITVAQFQTEANALFQEFGIPLEERAAILGPVLDTQMVGSMDKLVLAIDGLAKSLAPATTAMDDQVKQVAALEGAQSKLQGQVERLSAKKQELAGKVRDLTQAVKDGKASDDDLAAAKEKLAGVTDKLKAAKDKLKTTTEGLSSATKGLKPDIDAVGSSAGTARGHVYNLDAAFVGAVHSAQGAAGAFASAGSAAANSGGQASSATSAWERYANALIAAGASAAAIVNAPPAPPGFAHGVRNFAGGLALVGEQGPELVNLPRGSDVFSHPDTMSMVGHPRGVGGGDVYVTVQVMGSVTAEQDLAETIRRRLIEIGRRNPQIFSFGGVSA